MSWMIKPEGKFRYNRDFAKKAIADHRYDNSEKGFVGQKYIHFTKPSAMKKRHYVKVNLDKIDYWVEYLNHKLIMKEKFPLSDGKLCRYCEVPFTFIVPIKNFGEKNLQARRGLTNETNMSVDRLDNKNTRPCSIQVTSGDYFDEQYQPRQNKTWMEDNNGNT